MPTPPDLPREIESVLTGAIVENIDHGTINTSTITNVGLRNITPIGNVGEQGWELNSLLNELMMLEGVHAQHPDTGHADNRSQLGNYSNRLFGAPFQLLDSVDGRFPNINRFVGNEYLRNFILHSPILHMRPGMPKYTGGTNPTGTFTSIKRAYRVHHEEGGHSAIQELLLSAAQGTFFRAGARFQKRMFGFQQTYFEYMQYVNYMCRSVATLIGLTDSNEVVPNGSFVNRGGAQIPGFQEFAVFEWQNYRYTNMFAGNVRTATMDLLRANPLSNLIRRGVTSLFRPVEDTSDAEEAADNVETEIPEGETPPPEPEPEPETDEEILARMGIGTATRELEQAWHMTYDFQTAENIAQVLSQRVTSVMFMVEPTSFNETLMNTTEASFIAGMLDGITNSVGSEIAFITNSNVDLGFLGDITSMLGNTVGDAMMALGNIVSPVSGGFANNLFTGAIKAMKGQKMIYPDIYKSSSSSMDYEFQLNLTTPYGDIYNYYMNIVVPLLHLIGLVAPRMVTANTVASPFLVQAFIPGMCTCQLGIVSQMQISKNPQAKHVSVHGFPLTVKVQFTVKELYNAMSISPAHDPASFLFNETLNDYMLNMAGLIPGYNSKARMRAAAFANVGNYVTEGHLIDDIIGRPLGAVENFFGSLLPS